MKITDKKTPCLKCNNCGAELILIETTVKTINNSLSPITKTTYRCSDASCQVETDKRSAKRIELIVERELMQETRRKKSQELANAAKLKTA